MRFAFILSLLASFHLFGDIVDQSAASFELREKKRTDVFEFPGEYANLKNINIDATRKKKVEFYLNGDYPLLKTVNYEGGFGVLKGELTGKFPQLTLVNFLCTSCNIDFDLSGQWEQNCEITVRGMKEDITLILPTNVGLVIHTKTSPSGKVIANHELKKKGWLGVLNKTYYNTLSETSDVVLTLHLETTDGRIILN